MCSNENVIIARHTEEQRKESHSLKRELFVSRVFSTTQAGAALFILLSGFHPNSTRRRQERCSMIKQHRTIYKTIKSRAETFVGCIFDEISKRLWSRLSSSSRCGARALQRKKEESTRTGIGSANAERLSLNNSLTRRVGRQRGRRNSRGLG
jgi:hypothetical protein